MVKSSSKKRQRENDSYSDDDSENEYQVEAILDKRKKGKKIQYFLKWKGYSHADNTWEDEDNLNCPALVQEFEERSKAKTNENTSSSKSKNTNRQDSDMEYQSEGNQSVFTETGSNSTENDEQTVARHSPRKKASISKRTDDPSPSRRRQSNRKTVNQTKSRISSMSKTDSSNDENDDIIKELSSTNKSKTEAKNTSNEKPDDTNNNNSIDFPESTPTTENNFDESTMLNLRLRVTPTSTSSVSLILNDSENNLNNDDTIDETDQVEKIEAVRNIRGEISFQIKLINENQLQWISSKIANRKYPQAVIAFWEHHVEFT